MLLLGQLPTMLRRMLLLVVVAFALPRLRGLRVVHLRARLVVHEVGACPAGPCVALHAGVGRRESRLVEGKAAATHHGRPRFTNHIAAAVCAIVLDMVGELHYVLGVIEPAVVRVAS